MKGEKAEEESSDDDEGENDSEEEEGAAPKENGDFEKDEKTNGHANDSSHTNGKDSKAANGDIEMSEPAKSAEEKENSEVVEEMPVEVKDEGKSKVENGDKAAEEDVGKPVKPKESKGKSLKVPGAASSETKGEAGPGEEETGDGEVSNLQLAWEIFELAKNIYKRYVLRVRKIFLSLPITSSLF